MKLRLDGLRLRLLGLFFLPVTLVILAVAIVATDIHQEAMRGLVAARDERGTAAAAITLDQAIRSRLSLLDLAEQSLAANPDNLAALESQSDLIQSFPLGFAFYDSQGQLLGDPGSVITDGSIGQQLANAGGRRVLTTFANGEQIALLIGAPATITSAGGISLTDLLHTTAPILTGGGGEIGVYLVGPGAELLAASGKSPPENLADHVGVQAALRGESGSSFAPMSDGEHVVSYAPISIAGWALIVEEPWQAVSSSVLDLSLLAPFALVPVLILTLLSLWFGARRVIDPLRRLEEAASELPGGSSDAIEQPVGGIAEIEQLRESLVPHVKACA